MNETPSNNAERDEVATQPYIVHKPFQRKHRVLAVGDRLDLHPRAATFLLCGGFIQSPPVGRKEPADAKTAKAKS
ncbi:hypothetical protein [Pandoraea fibrosis]|uniref:Uncharacterized protein n=1 Tax=Pandoraea fibrosis TaxID=1891094 RepID=A0A5E4XFW2_9BURK|nr:hypothetical protein [Pandoraea fibrosis]VVE35048.1 hypothetical protein PFI31113_03815 [Pandoraea fibrosis]